MHVVFLKKQRGEFHIVLDNVLPCNEDVAKTLVLKTGERNSVEIENGN